MFLLLVGNFDKDKASEVIHNYMDKIDNKGKPIVEEILEDENVNTKEEVFYTNIKVPKVAIGLKVPTSKLGDYEDITLDKQITKNKDSQSTKANDSILKNYNKLYNLNKYTIKKLIELGVLKTEENSCRDTHVGKSDYSHKIIQPWTIWMEYKLNAWDADIIKRVLRTKEEANMTPEEARKMDYEKIIHDAKERIRQLDIEIQNKINKKSNED